MGLRSTAGTSDLPHAGPLRGRGAASNPEGRFETFTREREDDGWGAGSADAPAEAAPPPQPRTVVMMESVKEIVSTNRSPDLPFEATLNTYAGCEHGCAYCYARPTHAHFGLSPGLDFETRLFARHDAAERLRDVLARPRYRPRPIVLGGVTDGWQPAEREHRITRSVLEVLVKSRHPFTLVTKNALVERDIDLLSQAARLGLVHAWMSITTLDADLAWRLEPRASAPWRRLEAVKRLAAAGIPTGVLVAPVIPALNDHHMEAILEAAAQAGAGAARWVLLRLPHEVETLFTEWLRLHEPLRADRVLEALRDMHGGRTYDARFHHRQRGAGPQADMLAQRFELVSRRLALGAELAPLDLTAFVPPVHHDQLPLL